MKRSPILYVLPLVLAACAATVEQPTPVVPSAPIVPPMVETPADADAVVEEIVVEMTEAAFEPANITVRQGQTVTWVNTGTVGLWPASAPHPEHTDYPEFDAKQIIEPGERWSFTFDKVGEWKYHEHDNFKTFGSVTVTE